MNNDDLAQLLQQHGVQPTSQRIQIASLILGQHRHVCADEVLRRLHDARARVSKATVYNTLKLFCERGLLRTVDVDPVRQFYDSRIEPHHHFYNVDTGELTDIDPQDIDLNVSATLPTGTISDGAEVLIRVRQQPAG